MSRFLREMAKRSRSPEEYKQGTVPTVDTVPIMETVPKVITVPSETTVPTKGTVPKIQWVKAKNAQDAHTVWEDKLYRTLWAEAKGDGEAREISIGYRHIVAVTGLGLNTVQRNMKSLTDKLALEPIGRYDPDTRTPKTYRIYSFKAILERRRKAGLEWVLKNRQGVSLGTVPTVGTDATVATAPTVQTVPSLGIAAVPTVGTRDSPQGGDAFRELGNNKREETTSSSLIVQAARNVTLDDEAARRIIARCRAADPNATVEEIAHFVGVASREKPEAKAGLLMEWVPKYFEAGGTALGALREAKRREMEQSREAARAIESDPTASESEREWARAVLRGR